MFFTDPNWKSCWEGVKVTYRPETWVHKSCGLIYLANISRMSRTPAQWSHYRPTSRAAAKAQGAPSKPSFAPWSACWNVAWSRTANLGVRSRRPPPLCALEAWLWPGPWSIAQSLTNCASLHVRRPADGGWDQRGKSKNGKVKRRRALRAAAR